MRRSLQGAYVRGHLRLLTSGALTGMAKKWRCAKCGAKCEPDGIFVSPDRIAYQCSEASCQRYPAGI